MSTVGNGTTGASGTGPASEYNLVLSHLFIVFFLFLYRLSVNTSNSYAAITLLIFTHSMICFMIFGIKICHKMAKTLTHIGSVAGIQTGLACGPRLATCGISRCSRMSRSVVVVAT
jgi:hypothetical protein